MGVAIGALGLRRFAHRDYAAQLTLLLPILTLTILSKIGIPAGTTQIASFLPVGLMAIAFGFLTGRLEIQAQNLVAFTAMLSFILTEQVFGGHPFSALSLGLIFVVNLPFIFRIRPGLLAPDFHLRSFQSLAQFLAICGMAQFALQFVIGVDAAFPIDMKLPESIIMQGFHNMNPLGYNSSIYKSNGVFLIEPAFLSQFLAVSLLIELTYFRRITRIAIILGGMAVSFSGTGLVLLALALPVVVIQQRRFGAMLIAAVFAVVVAGIAGAFGLLDVFIGRLNEFSSTQSSGFARFFGGFYLFDQYLWIDPLRALFGMGAGSVTAYIETADYPSWDANWVKIPFEYGLAGAAVYFSFIIYCTFRVPGALTLKIAMLAALYVGATLGGVQTMIAFLLIWPCSAGVRSEPFRFDMPAVRHPAVPGQMALR